MIRRLKHAVIGKRTVSISVFYHSPPENTTPFQKNFVSIPMGCLWESTEISQKQGLTTEGNRDMIIERPKGARRPNAFGKCFVG